MPHVNRILEIGFNTGSSAEVFLKNSLAQIVSFDIGQHAYVPLGKEFIDSTFPGRHLLILGDSKHTVPVFAKNNPSVKFDLIFIDGGHDFDTALKDLQHCKQLAHADTLVVMDDTQFSLNHPFESYNIGPTLAWSLMVKNGHIEEIEHASYAPFRGQTVGKYKL